ncbi:MAG: LysR family transcriptional regulator [Clostridia bacterium]|nr:LysR family transcriptional regulator [Clostridia bacterium]
MELLQLKYFCDAAQTENFSETAKKFSVPPSNISQSVHRLEKELGTGLFERTANRIRLSHDGKIFLEGAKKALDCLENAKIAVQDTGEMRGEIKIGILTNRRAVTEVIGAFRKLYPKVNFHIQHTVERDADGFDIIIGDKHDYPVGFTASKLLEEDLVLAVHKDAEDKADFSELRFITMQRGSSQHRYTLEIARKNGFAPNIVIETDDPFYVREYIEMGLGAAIVPVFSWQGLFSDKICLQSIGNIKRTTFLYINKNRYESAAVRLFCRMLIKKCKSEK